MIEKVKEIEKNISKKNFAEQRRERRERMEKERELEEWSPKTELGRQVLAKKIKDIDEIFNSNLKILEAEVIDLVLPDLESELINIGQSKGKFGGGKRRAWRQTQKKTAEGNVPTFACMVIIGDKQGHVGLGYGKAKETLPAKQKSLRNAKLNLIRIRRGCGNFDCTCDEPHSIPFSVEGKTGSVKIKLMPAPKGTGLVADGECKKVFRLAGIKDIYTRTFGQTRTKINMIKACFEALKKLNEIV
jgi:small subunit ribosomal protein S5